jgi:hypothetical protein
MIPWVKLHTSIFADPEWTTLSAPARGFYALLVIGAGACDSTGALVGRGARAVSPQAILQWTGIDPAEQHPIFSELELAGYLVKSGSAWAIADWAVSQAKKLSTPRVQKHRAGLKAKQQNETSDETIDETPDETIDETHRREEKRREQTRKDETRRTGSRSPNVPPVVDFLHLEPLIQTFVTIMAGANRSGTLTPGRIASERAALKLVLDEFGEEAFEYGLEAAFKKNAGSVGYVKAAAKGFTERPQVLPLSRNGKPARSNCTEDYYPELK